VKALAAKDSISNSGDNIRVILLLQHWNIDKLRSQVPHMVQGISGQLSFFSCRSNRY
jgi:hypothetical protein